MDERDAISRRTREALAAAKAKGQVLGNYARISAAKQAATAHMSANAAAVDLNERGITTVAGGIWRAEQVVRARRQLGL